MAKPVVEWTEDDVLALPAGENDTFERKGSQLLDLKIPKVEEGKVLDELAKQLSAFANTGGGQLIYGVNDAGTVDNGGVARIIKGRQSTKEWLEEVIPGLTDFEIVGFNVFEILPKASGSSISAEKSLFVVSMPDSDRAPHQSRRDHKYYVRLGGKSRPAPHRLIEDIRNRATHPKLEVHDLLVVSSACEDPKVSGLTSDFGLVLGLQFALKNVGKIRAANACVQIQSCTQLFGNSAGPEGSLRLSYNDRILLEIAKPLYPEMVVAATPFVTLSASLRILTTSVELKFNGVDFSEAPLHFTLFADSAPAVQQDFLLAEADHLTLIQNTIKKESRRIQQAPRGLP